MKERPRLTCVYVDYGACMVPVEHGGVQAAPDVIEQIIASEIQGSDVIRKILYDHRGLEHEENWQHALNLILDTWLRMNYQTIACPRVGENEKETIDPLMIERVHDDVTIYQKAYSLHVILVVGDVDFRPLVDWLVNNHVDVTLIATQRHITLHQNTIKRLRGCYALFPIRDDEAYLFKPLPSAIRRAVGGETGAWQSCYQPSEEQFLQAKRFGDTTMVECPFCHDIFPTGHISNHTCDAVEANRPAAGLLTLPKRQELGIAFSRMSPERLIEELITYQHEQVLEEDIDRIFEAAPILPWKTIEIALLIFRMSVPNGLQTISLDQDQLRFLSHTGMIKREGDGYAVTDRVNAVRRLIEEVHHRTVFPITARLFSPEGALPGPELRRHVISTLNQRYTPLDLSAHASADDLWDSDLALQYLSHPELSPGQRTALLAETYEMHTLRFWNDRLQSLPRDSRTDILSMTEAVASEQETHFTTLQSVRILIANELLIFHPAEETLSINPSHIFFRPLVLEQAVA